MAELPKDEPLVISVFFIFAKEVMNQHRKDIEKDYHKTETF